MTAATTRNINSTPIDQQARENDASVDGVSHDDEESLETRCRVVANVTLEDERSLSLEAQLCELKQKATLPLSGNRMAFVAKFIGNTQKALDDLKENPRKRRRTQEADALDERGIMYTSGALSVRQEQHFPENHKRDTWYSRLQSQSDDCAMLSSQECAACDDQAKKRMTNQEMLAEMNSYIPDEEQLEHRELGPVTEEDIEFDEDDFKPNQDPKTNPHLVLMRDKEINRCHWTADEHVRLLHVIEEIYKEIPSRIDSKMVSKRFNEELEEGDQRTRIQIKRRFDRAFSTNFFSI